MLPGTTQDFCTADSISASPISAERRGLGKISQDKINAFHIENCRFRDLPLSSLEKNLL